MMDNIIFLILRRMRWPLLTLVLVYAVSVLGLVLIPGQDEQGNPWRMDFFHAFYFVSFMSTTIGFGEVPYEFTDAQRAWVMVTIYLSVIAWLYAIGNILNLLQDKAFKEAIREHLFQRRIKALREPFYVICGYGETGRELTRALIDRGKHVVVIDKDEHKISLIQLQNLRDDVPALHGNARNPRYLIEAGLEHEQCAGVVALTNDNEVNLKIAITAKLLNDSVRVVCRADDKAVERNMESFLDTDEFARDRVVDPFDEFARYLTSALETPSIYLLSRWLVTRRGGELILPVYPPVEGHWIIGGYGRFGKAVFERLKTDSRPVSVMEATPEKTGVPLKQGVIVGSGTEEDILVEAGIQDAVGIVAGTNDDSNNLSIVLTAIDLNPRMFVIARQNRRENEELFKRVNADMVMHPSSIIAEHIRVMLATPLLYEFMELARLRQESWACEVIARIIALGGVEEIAEPSDVSPLRKRPGASGSEPDPPRYRMVFEIQEFDLSLPPDEKDQCAVHRTLLQGRTVRIADLMKNLWDQKPLQCIPLLRVQNKRRDLLPEAELELALGDRLLFCGTPRAFSRMRWIFCHQPTLDYALSGQEQPRGWIWRQLRRRHWV